MHALYACYCMHALLCQFACMHSLEGWYNLVAILDLTSGSFIGDFASANLPIKATQARGYTWESRVFIKYDLIKSLPCPKEKLENKLEKGEMWKTL